MDSTNGTLGGNTPTGGQVPSPPRLSGMAVASLVLAIIGPCIASLPALILGIVAYIQIGKNPGRLRGSGVAVAGIIVSALSVFLLPILAAILFPVFAKAHAKAIQTTCQSNLKCVSLALREYSMDYDGHYPPASRWNEAVHSMHAPLSQLSCPAADSKTTPSYALNKNLAGKSESEITDPKMLPQVFDSIPGRNKSGGKELLPNPGRHSRGNVIAFADGHVRWFAPEGLTAKWELSGHAKTSHK